MAEKTTPVRKPAAKPKAAAKAKVAPATKTAAKPAGPSVAKLIEAAQAAEHELAAIVGAATEAGNWQPVQADECRRLAGEAVEARTAAAKIDGTVYEPGSNVARWL